MNNYNGNIGERIKLIRKHFQLTQQQFASQLGISRSHISNIENGNETPSQSLVLFISTKFPVKLEWIISEEGIMLRKEDEVDIKNCEHKFKLICSNLSRVYKATETYKR